MAPSIDSRPMLLVVDVGNTQTHFGTFRGDELVEHWRFATVRESTADELGARAARTCSSCAASAWPTSTPRSSPRPCPQLGPEWSAMAERYLDHRMLVVGPGIRPAWRCATTTRARSAPTGSSTRSPATTSVGGACIVVDFGTAITYDLVSARRRVPRRHHHRRASRSRSRRSRAARAKLPRIDLGAAAPLIGKTTVDAIRSGIVYGFAGAGRRASSAACAPSWARTRDDDRHRRPGRAHRARTRTRSTRSTTCSRSTGSSCCTSATRRRPRDGPRLPCRRGRSLREPFEIGGVRIPNRVVLAPLAGHRQLVRAPAGQALRRRPGGLGDGVELRRSTTATSKTCTEMLRIHPEERARRPGLDPALRPGPGRHALGRRRRRRSAAPTSSTSTWAAPCPRSARPARRRAARRPRHRRRGRARRAREGSGPAGHGEAALGPARPATRDGLALAHRLVDEAGVAAIAFHPRSARRSTTRACPDYELAAAARRDARRAGDPHRRPARRARGRAPPSSSTGAAAVMLARGALGNPWLFERAARRARRRRRRRDEVLAELDWVMDRAVEHLGPRARGALPAQVLPLVRRAPGRSQAEAAGGAAADATRWRRDGRCAARRAHARPLERGAMRAALAACQLSRPAVRASRSTARGSMPKDVILTPEGLEKLKDELEDLSDGEAPRGRRAHQGGARVRRHLRELGVRRRQERAGDARAAHRRSSRSGCAPPRSSTPRTLSTDVVRRRLGRPRQGREDRQVARSSRSSARPRPTRPSTKLSNESPVGKALLGPQARRDRRGPGAQRPEAQAQDHQDRRRPA